MVAAGQGLPSAAEGGQAAVGHLEGVAGLLAGVAGRATTGCSQAPRVRSACSASAAASAFWELSCRRQTAPSCSFLRKVRLGRLQAKQLNVYTWVG